MRIWRKPLSVLLGAAVLVGSAACAAPTQSSPEGDSSTATVGLTFIPNVQFSPVYLADFSTVDADVQIRHHGTDEGLFSALVTGDEQVTVATGDEVLQARAQGMDIVSVAAYYHQYPVEIVVPEDSSIAQIADLRGMRVGIPGEFGSNWFGLLAALDAAGMTTADIDVVSVGFTQAASLASGEVDAIVGFVNSEPAHLSEMGFPARSLPMSEDGLPLVGATVVTTRAWADENPVVLKQILSSLIGGVERAIDDPEAALDATETWDESLSDKSARAGAKAVLEATIPLWRDASGQASGLQDLDQWRQMAPFLERILGEPGLVDASEGAVTNEYVD